MVPLAEDDLDSEPPPPPGALGVLSAAAFFSSGETLPASAGPGIGELARLGTASAFVGTDDTVPSAAAGSDILLRSLVGWLWCVSLAVVLFMCWFCMYWPSFVPVPKKIPGLRSLILSNIDNKARGEGY